MKVFEFEKVTRATVVLPDGVVLDRYDAFPAGVELHLQNDGRTLKLFPAGTGSDDVDNNGFQDLGGGVYRVGGMSRSALTGRYRTSTEHDHHQGEQP